MSSPWHYKLGRYIPLAEVKLLLPGNVIPLPKPVLERMQRELVEDGIMALRGRRAVAYTS
jgi:hypothetical protein